MATSAQSSPHGNLRTYLSVFAALCALTGISFAVANSQPLMANPAVGWSIMMAVSAGKALLVVLFFMHLKYEANWKYVLTIPTMAMAAFLVFALVPDIGERTEHYSDERWLHAAVPGGAGAASEPSDQAPEANPEAHAVAEDEAAVDNGTPAEPVAPAPEAPAEETTAPEASGSEPAPTDPPSADAPAAEPASEEPAPPAAP